MSRLARIVGGVLSTSAVLFALCAPAAHAAPVTSTAAATDAIVAMKVIFTAQMYIPATGSTPGAWSDVTEARYICEGYFVDDTASIATTSGCVDATDNYLRRTISRQIGSDLNWSQTQIDAFESKANSEQWQVRASASNPTAHFAVDLSVRQTTGDNRQLPSWSKATVVKSDDYATGGSRNALIKLDQPRTGLPFLPLATVSPNIGEKVTVYGFPEDATTTSEPTPPPLSQEGTVTARPVTAVGATLTQVSMKLLSGSLGAPGLNSTGQVIGTANDYQGVNGTEATDNTLSDTVGLRTFLTQNGVVLADPAADDTADGSGVIWVVIAAVIIALVVIALVVAIVLIARSRKRKSNQFASATPGFTQAPGTGPTTWAPAPQYQSDQFTGGQYSGGQYSGSQYTGGQYPGGQYTGGQQSGPQVSPYGQGDQSGPQQQWSTGDSGGNYNPTTVAPSWPPVTGGTDPNSTGGGLPFADPPEERK